MGKMILDDFVQSVTEQKLNILNMNVRKNGEIIAKHDFVEEKPSVLWSASKTFTSMAIGIARGEGLLDLDNKVIDYFKDDYDIPDNNYLKKMTIHDLLCMGSGHAECPIMKAEWTRIIPLDIVKLFFDEPIKYEPGTRFTYDNSATYMLSRIITKVTGKSLLDYAYEKIFKPLDIPKPRWATCPRGYTQGFSGLYLTAEQLSRFGQLILNKGKWNDTQLIPQDYIEKATSVQISTVTHDHDFTTADHHMGYGYQIWMNSYAGSYRLDGMFGQFVIIVPEKNALITFVSHEERAIEILEIAWKHLIDKL